VAVVSASPAALALALLPALLPALFPALLPVTGPVAVVPGPWAGRRLRVGAFIVSPPCLVRKCPPRCLR
jgi:hypothetical protein